MHAKFLPDDVIINAADLKLLLNELMGRYVRTAETKLSGPEALQACVDGLDLKIERLEVQTSDGRHWPISSVRIPLPVLSERDEPMAVRIGFAERSALGTENSELVLWKPQPRLLAPGENSAWGELTLGTWDGRNLYPEPVPAERLDGCPANRDWLARQQGRAKEAWQLLVRAATKLHRTHAPVLVWQAILGPVTSSLLRLERLPVSCAPETALAAVEECIALFAAIPDAAAAAGDAEILSLCRILNISGTKSAAVINESAATDFAGRCARSEFGLQGLRDDVGRLTECLGTGLTSLPNTVYHVDRSYRRIGMAAFESCETKGDKRIWRAADCHPQGALAVLWKPMEATMDFGAACFYHEQRGRRSREVFLGRLEASDYHWIDGPGLNLGYLEAPANWEISDSAFYVA